MMKTSKDFFVWLIALMVLARILVFAPTIGLPLYYSVFAITGIVILFRSSDSKINLTASLFYVVALLSIFFNDIPSFFRPYERYFSFCLVTLSIGPLFVGRGVCRFRMELFDLLLKSCVVICILSFIAYTLQLPFCFDLSGFSGLTVHSMLLGPVSAIAFLYSFYLFLNRKGLKKWVFWGVVLGGIMALLCCLLSASRAAFLGMVVGFFYQLWRHYHGRIWKLMKLLIPLAVLVGATYALWNPYAKGLENKQSANVEAGGTFASRDTLWEDRWNEYYSSPVIGVGFSSMDVRIAKSSYQIDTGIVEPGTGWLFILSSMGILGLFSFLLFTLFSLIRQLFRRAIPFQPLTNSVMMFFVVHLFAEGYVTASGSFLFFMLWLTIGVNSVVRGGKVVKHVKRAPELNEKRK